MGLLDVGGLEILRCAQDDKPLAVILSAAKDLSRAFVQSSSGTGPLLELPLPSLRHYYEHSIGVCKKVPILAKTST